VKCQIRIALITRLIASALDSPWVKLPVCLAVGAALGGSLAEAAVFNFNPPSGSVNASFAGGAVTMTITGGPGTNVATASANDLIAANGVVAWSSGSTVYSYVFDPGKSNWVGSSTAQGPTFDLNTADGVVAWSTGGGVFFRAYDPSAGAWVGSSVAGAISGNLVLNTGGVVAWSRDNLVNFTVYDPTRGGWRNSSAATSNPTFDLQNADGVVAWSANSPLNTQIYRVEYQVYDPRRGAWVSGNVPNSAYTANLSIQNSVVFWTAIGDISYNRGYNPNTGAWETSPTPLAYFAVSTNAGNAPFSVSFIDMSIGGTSWSWNFGDGLGTSFRRSPIYRYTTFGRFNATLTANDSSTNRTILTDIIPPNGTNRINNGAAFTTNPVVTLTLSATDNSGVVASNRFSNGGVTWSDWEPFGPSKTWTLSAGNGAKTVLAQFLDRAGNTSANASASIQLDSTPLPLINLVNTNIDESAGVVTVVVALDHAYSQTVSVRFSAGDGTASAPADYSAASGLLTFPSNTTTRSISIPIVNDGLVETNETVLIVFSNVTNGVAGPPGTITIFDDDPATVTFASTNFSAIEGSGAASITVTLNAASGLPVTVRYAATNGMATPGIDYQPVEDLLMFAPGQTSRTFTVPLINESLDELSETVELKLIEATNAFIGSPFQATLTILDDDNPVVFFSSSQYSVSETSGVVRASVRLSKPFFDVLSVDYAIGGGTAMPGEDYPNAVSGVTLLFQPGQTNKDISVTILNDTRAESDETIHLTLSDFFNVSPGPVIEADIVILDDDGAPLLVAPSVNTNGQFRVIFQGKPGQRFNVEASTNLPFWFPLATLTNITGTLPYTDPTPATGRSRFYRSLVTP
jgi:PKD repeat protein